MLDWTETFPFERDAHVRPAPKAWFGEAWPYAYRVTVDVYDPDARFIWIIDQMDDVDGDTERNLAIGVSSDLEAAKRAVGVAIKNLMAPSMRIIK